MKTNYLSLVLFALLNYFAATLGVEAVVPAPDGGYPGLNTAEGENAPERQSELHPQQADTARHQPVAPRGPERPLRARDCAGRRRRQSERCAVGIFAASHDFGSPEAGFQRRQRSLNAWRIR